VLFIAPLFVVPEAFGIVVSICWAFGAAAGAVVVDCANAGAIAVEAISTAAAAMVLRVFFISNIPSLVLALEARFGVFFTAPVREENVVGDGKFR